MRRPLADIKVVELGLVVAGPYAALLLGDLGADVVKVEPPQGDETRNYSPFAPGTEFSAFSAAFNRGKRSIALDLKRPEAKEAYLAISAGADIVLENLRAGVSDRLEVGYGAVRKRNPEVIYCAISGFGHKGPRAQDPAMDLFIQAFSGQMSMIGHDTGNPARIGPPMMDLTASLHAVIAVLAALSERQRTGRGALVQTSLLEAQIACLSYMWPALQFQESPPGPMGSGHPAFCPYQAFAAQDGQVIIAALNDRLFAAVAAAIGQPELAEDARFRTNADRLRNRETLIPIVAGFVASRTMADTVERMRAHGAPATPVNTLDKVRADVQINALGGMRRLDQPGVGPVEIPHQALWFDGERSESTGPAPALGEHSREILEEAGLAAKKIDALFASGAARASG